MNKKEITETHDWCPTQRGTYTAYEPEWFNLEWKSVPCERSAKSGVPYPMRSGGINLTIGLMGYAQAQAIAWGYAAQAEAEGHEILVRVQAYHVEYDIKARKIKS